MFHVATGIDPNLVTYIICEYQLSFLIKLFYWFDWNPFDSLYEVICLCYEDIDYMVTKFNGILVAVDILINYCRYV